MPDNFGEAVQFPIGSPPAASSRFEGNARLCKGAATGDLEKEVRG